MAVGLPLVVCGLIGLVNGLLVARLGLAPFIVTLASLLFAPGLLLTLTSEGSTTLLTGGAGSILGTLVGVLLRNVIANVIDQIGGRDSNFQSVISGALLLLVVVAQRLPARTRATPRT